MPALLSDSSWLKYNDIKDIWLCDIIILIKARFSPQIIFVKKTIVFIISYLSHNLEVLAKYNFIHMNFKWYHILWGTLYNTFLTLKTFLKYKCSVFTIVLIYKFPLRLLFFFLRVITFEIYRWWPDRISHISLHVSRVRCNLHMHKSSHTTDCLLFSFMFERDKLWVSICFYFSSFHLSYFWVYTYNIL